MQRLGKPRFTTHLAVLVSLAATAATADEQQAQSRDRLKQPVYRVAQAPAKGAAAVAPAHPLDPVLKMARDGLTRIDRDVSDYTATLIKRERVDGTLGNYQYMYVKVRNKPFSVYMYFLGPKQLKGREVIYRDGWNNGKLRAHEGSGLKGFVTVNLDPKSALAMKGNRYPVTELGIRNLTYRLLEVGERDRRYGECDVKYFKGAKVGKRVCTCLQVTHPYPRKQFLYNIARIFIDDELQVPIRFESYTWPQTAGGKPILLEEYTYMNLKLNVGLKDADFDPDNPNYRF